MGVALFGVLAASCGEVHAPTGPGTLVSIAVTPNPTLSIGATQQFVAVGYDAAGEVVTLSPDWSIVQGGGAISNGGMFTAGDVIGLFTATVRAASGGVSGTATVTVVPGALAAITVTPNPESLGVHESQQFTAVGTDAGGNVLSITPLWSVEAGGGSIGNAGLFTAGSTAGTYDNTVRASSGSISGYATVTVVPAAAGALVSLTVTPNPVTLPTGGTQQYTVVGRDASDNVVPVTPTWSVVAGGGSITSAGVFTAGNTVATFPNTVRATSGSVTGEATVIVTATPVGPLATITVTPDPITLVAGGTQQFAAVGRDASGVVVPITPVWSVVAAGGTIGSAGLFTAGTTPGTYGNTVRATSGGISGDATVTVTAVPAAPLATITVTPNPVSMLAGADRQFTAVGRDAGGNILTISPVWSVEEGGGTIGNGGLFTAGTTLGTFAGTVQATSGTISGNATVTVTAPPVIVNLGAAETHGILAGSTLTCVTLGTVNADASVWPGSAITGFPPCTITGATHAADPFAQTAQGALTTAYNQLDGMPCGSLITSDLGGTTMQPGVACSTSSVGLTGEMFLDALGDGNAIFVIKAASTLTTAAARVTLLNGAQAKNVYWLVGSSATLGTGSAMKGNIIAFTTITLNDTATLTGRALARNGAVTLGTGNTITLP